jgi:hypothetical protein
MMFYCSGLRKVDECTEPTLPEGFGYLIVVYGSDYAIFESDWLGDDLPEGVYPLPEGLRRLLSSATGYPPARALAMESCERRDLPYDAMCRRLFDSLLLRSRSQAEDGFRFLRASGDQVGYMNRGQFYWVLGYLCDYVYWVSSDYQIYPDHCSAFGLEEDDLPRLFPRNWQRKRSGSD